MLKKIRIPVAVLMFTVILFYFLDFVGVLPQAFPNLARIQFVPALLSGTFIVLGLLLLLTFLFGRVYCSVICPLGILQDVVAWFARRINRKKRYSFSREKKWLRYLVLAGVVAAFLLGGTVVLSLLDPYSAFGRIAVNVFRPVYMGINNVGAAVFNYFDNYSLYHTDIYVLSLFSLLAGIVTFGVVAYLAYRYGRTYCNTICPVGTVLGVISRRSLWRVRIDPDACVSCGLCERKCKSSCIDSKGKTVDGSRCVACYNCLTTCPKQALSYRPAWKTAGTKACVTDAGKRQFMAALAVGALAVAPRKTWAKGIAAIEGNKTYQKQHPLSPPGAVSAEHLLRHCTACHLCVAKCPSKVLKPTFMDYGVGGMMQPKMDFEHGFCNFDCTVCTEVCPNGALLKLTKQEKHTLQVGRVVFVEENCIVYSQGTSCGACSEHCPTQAVSMQPYKNGLTIPVVHPDICVGCGGCEYVCPVRPFRAIYIEGNPVHQQAVPFKEAEKKEIELDGFGF